MHKMTSDIKLSRKKKITKICSKYLLAFLVWGQIHDINLSTFCCETILSSCFYSKGAWNIFFLCFAVVKFFATLLKFTTLLLLPLCIEKLWWHFNLLNTNRFIINNYRLVAFRIESEEETKFEHSTRFGRLSQPSIQTTNKN